MKAFLKHYQKEFIGLVVLASIIGSFFQEGFYIYGVVILTIYFASIYEAKTISTTLHKKQEKEKKKLIDYLDRKEEIKEKKDINNDY